MADAEFGHRRDQPGLARGRADRKHRAEFEEQITELRALPAQQLARQGRPKTGNPVYEKPVVLVIYREDHRFLLDQVRAAARRGRRPITTWSSPRSPIAPAPRSSSRRAGDRAAGARLAPGGRLIGIHSHGDDPGWRSSSASGPARIRSRPTGTSCCTRPRRNSARPGAISISTPIPMRARCSATTCTRCRAKSTRDDRHLDPVRRLERGDLCRADRGPAPGRGDRSGAYLEATAVLQRHGGLWFWDESFVISRKRNSG